MNKYFLTPSFYLLVNSTISIILLLQNIIFILLLNKINFSANLFNFDLEFNIPSLYSSLIILLASIFLLRISKKENSLVDKNRFRFLSLIFLYLSLDEFFFFHERITNVLNFNISGTIFLFSFFKYWFIPYSIILFIILIFFYPLISKQSPNLKYLIISSVLIYILGAVGCEVIMYVFIKFSEINREDILFKLLVTIEEILEIIGINLFNFVLLKKLRGLKI